jgi:CBS domain containing-hemolysin-like protein
MAATWIGLVLSAVGAFVLSLAHMSFAAFSRISLSGFLEGRETPDRQDILKRYEDIRIAFELWRIIFLIALLVYVCIAAPGVLRRPLLLFLGAAVVYALVFDALARLIGSLGKETLIVVFLRARRLMLVLASPILLLTRWLYAREESEEEADEDREASDEEIDTFLDEAEEEGIIEEHEGDLLRSVVEFGDAIVREIMTPRVDMVCIRKDATVQKLRNLIITEKYSRIPIYKDRVDNLEGMVMAKDLLAYSEKEFDPAPIEPLIRPVLFVPESMMVSDLLREFQKGMQKMAIVVDEHGGVTGLVTMEDVVEEIVGEIRDEYDTEEAQITEVGPKEFLVSGGAKVEEIEDVLGMELAADDFITVSGMITHRLGRLPAKGETLAFDGGLAAEIMDVDQKRIKKVRFRKE